MIPVQSTFQYLGDPDEAPFPNIDLSLLFPIFDYIRPEPETDDPVAIVRKPVAVDPRETRLALSGSSYRISFPASDLTGAGPSIANFLMYTARATRSESLGDLSFPIPTRIRGAESGQGAPLSAGILQAIYLIRNISRFADTLGMLARGRVEPDPERAAAFLEGAVILLNKDVYTEILPDFKELANQTSDWSLLALIQRFLDATGLDPTHPLRMDDRLREQLAAALTEARIENQGRVTEFLGRNLPRLFDFPIVLPAVRTLEVAGVFEIENPGDTPLGKDVFGSYDLALEYTVQEAAGTPAARTVRFDWGQAPDPADDRIAFSFAGAPPIVTNMVASPITVRVKSFDGATLWSRDYLADDPALREIHIVVAWIRPVTLTGAAPDSPGKRLRGRVLELTKQCSLKALTVVIQAKQDGDILWRVVGAATTDASGSFSLAYPYGPYTHAQAIVSLTPNSPADVAIRPVEGRPNETISDDFLYLLVTNPECEDKDPCDGGCEDGAPHKASRLPDQAALITSDEYTQDIGGACVNLSTPNRTLSEYRYTAVVRTSDPDVANYTLSKNPDTGEFDLSGGVQKIQRAPVDLDNPIRWQDAPAFHNTRLSVYQAVTVATGHVLHYRAEFRADGYSLGELLYSLALAPGQKKQIVVIDAAHSLLGSETQAISQGESLSATLVNEREILDRLGGNINEAMRGSSSASTSGVSAGLGVGVNLGYIGAALGVAGGTSSSSGSASQNSSRDTSMFFGEKLRQAIMQNAQSYRQLNATVVTSVREGQQYAVNTDVVANHNHCHALTMMYFEVLRHYAIFQDLASVEECIFVPFLMTDFSAANIYKWSDVLAPRLLPLPSNTYLQPFPYLRYRASHPLQPAFDAIRRRETNYKFVDFPKGAYCDEPITSVTGYLTLRIDLPRPKSVYDRILAFPVVKREEIHNTNPGGILGHIVDRLVGENNVKTTWEEKVKFANDHIIIYDNFQQAPPAEVIEVVNFDNFFDKGSKDGNLWTDIAKLCGYDDVYAFLENFFAHKTISQWTQVYNEEIAPRIVEALLDGSFSIVPFGNVDFTPTAKYHGGSYLMRLNLRTSISVAPSDPSLQSVRLNFTKTLTSPNDFWAWATFTAEQLNINYTTRHYDGTIINRYLGDDLSDNDGAKNPPISTPMNADEQRDPRTEDAYLERMLIEHLNSNLEYYNKVLWLNLDPDRRYMLLDGFNIETYNDFGVAAGKRSLASVVKNELVTIAGNSLVFPIAAGYRVSRSYIAQVNQDGMTENVSLFDHYKPYTPIPPYRISVPSRGVFAEAVMGQCDACEMVKPNSSQDWTRFTTDEPTSVQPVITPIPTVTDWKAVFKDFAQPLVSIQNAPALPAPGAGTAGVAELLGKAGVFKDITGLDATQQNAMRTYLSNQENARAFAEMAKNMVMQDHNTQHSDQIMGSLKSARDGGAISQDDYNKLVKEHLQKQIDGGEAQNRQQDQERKQKEPSAIKSAVDLAQSGSRDVSASESDSQGNSKTLEVKSIGAGGAGQTAYDFTVPGTITPIKQPTANACWATVTTMMSNWKKGQSQSVDDYVKSVGAEYVQYITTGISLTKLADFCDKAGFTMASSNTEYPVSFYYDVLRKHGPIWVIDLESADPRMLHGRLLVGIKGDGASPSTQFTLVDPATGSRYQEDLPTFVAKTEAVVKTLEAVPDAQVPLLVYFK
ncbi:MAG TPA: papain-like cysteine protease family protein, partial [Gemmatimonadales bacterium]|nr:papain-like cysteine protease family protein [Gemmatimonadales bacterium]